MGAGHAKAVYALWGHLPAIPFRVLVFMALIAKDGDDRPPRFFGGRDMLATAALSRPNDTADEREASNKALTRVMDVLTRAGAIALDVPPAPGRHAEYTLNLSMERSPVSGDRTVPGERGPYDRNPSVERSPLSGSNGPRSAGERSPLTGDRYEAHTVFLDKDIGGLKRGQTTDGVRAGATRASRVSRTRARAAEQPPVLSMIDGHGSDTGDRQPGLWPAAVKRNASGQ